MDHFVKENGRRKIRRCLPPAQIISDLDFWWKSRYNLKSYTSRWIGWIAIPIVSKGSDVFIANWTRRFVLEHTGSNKRNQTRLKNTTWNEINDTRYFIFGCGIVFKMKTSLPISIPHFDFTKNLFMERRDLGRASHSISAFWAIGYNSSKYGAFECPDDI